MYPTLNVSLLAQPGTATNGEAPVLEITDAAGNDFAASFQATLARDHELDSEGGNRLPVDGTILPETLLATIADADAPGPDSDRVPPMAIAGSLLEAARVEPVDPPAMRLDFGIDAGGQGESVEPVLPAGLPGDVFGATPTGPASGGPEVIRPVQTPPVQPPAGATVLPVDTARPPALPPSSRVGAPDRNGPGVPATEVVGPSESSRRDATVATAAPLREGHGTPSILPEPARQPGETELLRSSEQRGVPAPSLSSFEAAAGAAPQARPTINIAAPVQFQAPQSVPVEAPIQVPVGEAGFDDAIADRVWVMAQAKLGNAEIRLTPAELGPVRVQLAVDDGTANVTFQAAHAPAREAIEQALPRLRELLAENGLSLGQASVGDDGVRDGQPETQDEGGSVALADEAGDGPEQAPEQRQATRAGRMAVSLVDTFA